MLYNIKYLNDLVVFLVNTVSLIYKEFFYYTVSDDVVSISTNVF